MTAAELHGTTDDALAVVRAQDAAKQMIRRSLGWGGWVITDFVRAERLQASGRSVVLSLRTFDRANVACEVVVRRVLPLESPESQERPGAVIAVVEGSETGLIPTGVGVHYPPPPVKPLRERDLPQWLRRERGPDAAAGNEEGDDERLLSRTSAAIARGDRRMLRLQTIDVRRRMRRLSDLHEDAVVRQAAHAAEASLATVLGLLDGDVEPDAARPVARGLDTMLLDLAEMGIILEHTEAGVGFKAVRMLLGYANGRWRVLDRVKGRP